VQSLSQQRARAGHGKCTQLHAQRRYYPISPNPILQCKQPVKDDFEDPVPTLEIFFDLF
jgi:hypothetical protein